MQVIDNQGITATAPEDSSLNGTRFAKTGDQRVRLPGRAKKYRLLRKAY
jgi:hypothetical protein